MSVNQSDKEQIFNSAADLADTSQRAAYLDQACGDDAQLRAEIEELLRHDVDAGSFLEHPAADFVPTIAISEFDTVDDSVGEVCLAFLEPIDKTGCIGTLEHYEVVELVGRGGMGLVLKAFDPKLNRVVAIKVMAPELAASAMAVKRFLREARAAAAVSHDHVVTIHAIHDSYRPPFIVMEFVDGQSLQEKIDQTGGLELEAVLRIGMQAARGLAAAHEQGLVHRDIKPANVLLENGVERVKLTDFGLARAVDDVSVTQTGQIAGTPQFMSPEQAQGYAIDARSDLFSLGSMLYTMCTGRPPFHAETAVAMLRRVTDDDPRPIREVNADIPDWLQAITAKLLAKDPDARFRSAAEVADLLSQHLAHLQNPSTAPEPESVERPALVDPRGAPSMKRAKDVKKPTARPLWPAVAIGVAAMLCGIAALGAVIYVVTDKGTLVIESEDDNAVVTISKPVSDTDKGFEIQVVDKITGSGVVALRSGHYRLLAFDTNLNVDHELKIQLSKEQFVLRRGGRVVIKVSRIPKHQTTPDNALSTAELPQVRRFKGHTKRPMDLLFLADGKHALSCGGDETIRQWNVETGEVVRQFVDDPMHVASCLALSADGKTLLSGHGDGDRVRIWDFETGRVLHRIDAHQSSVFDVGFIPGTHQIVTAAYDNYVRYWDSTTGERVGEVGPLDGAACFTVAPDGSVLHGRHDRLQFLSAADRTIARELLGHRGGVSDIAISPNGKLAATASDAGPVYLWNLESGEQPARLDGHNGKVTVVTFTPDNRHLLSGGWDRTLRVWNVATQQEVARATTSHRVSLEVAVSPNGRNVLAGGGEWWDNDNKKWVAEGDFDLRLWRLPESVWQKDETTITEVELVRRSYTDPMAKAIVCLAISPDGRRALTGDFAGGVCLWDVQKDNLIRSFEGHTRCIQEVAFSPDGRHGLSGAEDGTIRLWDLETGKQVRQFSEPGVRIMCVAFSPDGKTFASGSADYQKEHEGSLTLWDVESDKLLRRLPTATDWITKVLFTLDGHRLVAIDGSAGIGVWDVASGEAVHQFRGFPSTASRIALSRDGRYLLSGHSANSKREGAWNDPENCVLRLWDLEHLTKPARVFRGHSGPIVAIDFSPNGRLLLSASSGRHDAQGTFTQTEDRTIRLWDVESGRELCRYPVGERINAAAIAPDGRSFLSGGNDMLRLWDVPPSISALPRILRE